MITKILVAFDGSDPSRKAFLLGADLARRYKAELFVLTVATVPDYHDEVETQSVMERSRAHGRSLLRSLEHEVGKMGVSANFELAVGHPAQNIVDHAEQRHVDLIVLGHRGRGALDRWRLGSVTHRVVAYATCAVTVVR